MYLMAVLAKKSGGRVEEYRITSYDDSEYIVFVDLDTQSTFVVARPSNVDELEDILEKYNPSILVCKSLQPSLQAIIEDMGVKVINAVESNLVEFLKEIL